MSRGPRFVTRRTACGRIRPSFWRRRDKMRFPRFYYGWWIVVVSFIGDFMSAGVGAFAFSLFLKPMSEELGWARSMTAPAFTLRTIAGAVSAPIMGPLLDRYGARPL